MKIIYSNGLDFHENQALAIQSMENRVAERPVFRDLYETSLLSHIVMPLMAPLHRCTSGR